MPNGAAHRLRPQLCAPVTAAGEPARDLPGAMKVLFAGNTVGAERLGQLMNPGDRFRDAVLAFKLGVLGL